MKVMLARLLSGMFFSRQFLQGRWFTTSKSGYVWALKGIWFQKVLGFNRKVPWPIHPTSKVSVPENISFHPDNLDNFQSHGCYFQNFAARIEIGHGTYIAPNVGIITANHDPNDLESTDKAEDVRIGKGCWLGMNSVILPGVNLGDGTVVGAGAVVTKSFPEGNCVLGGVPARKIRDK